MKKKKTTIVKEYETIIKKHVIILSGLNCFDFINSFKTKVE